MAKTKFEDCQSIVGAEFCQRLQDYEDDTQRQQIMLADLDSEESLIEKSAHLGVNWVDLVKSLTQEILEQRLVTLYTEQLQLKAELQELRELAAQKNLTVKSGGQVEVDWRSVLRNTCPEGQIY